MKSDKEEVADRYQLGCQQQCKAQGVMNYSWRLARAGTVK